MGPIAVAEHPYDLKECDLCVRECPVTQAISIETLTTSSAGIGLRGALVAAGPEPRRGGLLTRLPLSDVLPRPVTAPMMAVVVAAETSRSICSSTSTRRDP